MTASGRDCKFAGAPEHSLSTRGPGRRRSTVVHDCDGHLGAALSRSAQTLCLFLDQSNEPTRCGAERRIPLHEQAHRGRGHLLADAESVSSSRSAMPSASNDLGIVAMRSDCAVIAISPGIDSQRMAQRGVGRPAAVNMSSTTRLAVPRPAVIHSESIRSASERVASEGMAASHDDRHLVRIERHADEVAGQGCAQRGTQREVERLVAHARQRRHRHALDDADIHRKVAPKKLERPRQQRRRGGGRCTQHDGAARLRHRIGKLGLPALDLAARTSGAQQERVPMLRQLGATGRAADQRHADLRFECTQALRRRRLRDPERARRPTDAAGFGKRHELAQLGKTQ